MGVLGQLAVEGLQEELISHLPHVHAGLIQHSKYALMLLLHQVHDDLVVEVVDLHQAQEETGRLGKVHLTLVLERRAANSMQNQAKQSFY